MSLHKQMNLQSEKQVVVHVLYLLHSVADMSVLVYMLSQFWGQRPCPILNKNWFGVVLLCTHVYWNGGCYLWWCHLFWGGALVEFMCLIYTHMPGDCYCRWFRVNLTVNSLFLFSFYWLVSFVCVFVVTQSTCSSTSHQTSMKSCSRHWMKVMCVALRTKILSLMARTWRPSSPC